MTDEYANASTVQSEIDGWIKLKNISVIVPPHCKHRAGISKT